MRASGIRTLSRPRTTWTQDGLLRRTAGTSVATTTASDVSEPFGAATSGIRAPSASCSSVWAFRTTRALTRTGSQRSRTDRFLGMTLALSTIAGPPAESATGTTGSTTLWTALTVSMPWTTSKLYTAGGDEP